MRCMKAIGRTLYFQASRPQKRAYLLTPLTCQVFPISLLHCTSSSRMTTRTAPVETKQTSGSLSNGSGKQHKAVHISSGEMLDQLVEEMTQHVPGSYTITVPIRCHQLGEMPQDFYVDQWPSANICVGILKPEYFHKFKTPPYQIMHIYSRTEDEGIYQQLFNSLPINWNKPIVMSPGSNKQQTAIVSRIFRQHGGQPMTHEVPRRFYYATSNIKPVPLHDEYEYVRLNPDNVPDMMKSWGFHNTPFTAEDVATLTERFPFGGFREKSTGKLIAYGGQLHCGTSGCNRVDEAHRGKKLFQALISKGMAGCVERYGVATADILEDNTPSIAAFTNIGFQEHKGHTVYWIYMHPSALGPCPFSWN